MKTVKFGDPIIQTLSGQNIKILNPKPEQIDIRDIAHALSNLCRFNGQCKFFYSVAAHSIKVAESCFDRLTLAALLHDASEAYIGDVIKPLKNILPEYMPIEKKWEKCIEKRFGIAVTKAERLEIKNQDMAWFNTEAAQLMTVPVFVNGYKVRQELLPMWDACRQTEKLFLDFFQSVYRG